MTIIVKVLVHSVCRLTAISNLSKNYRMKKSFVTALVVGSCMLASETSASAQDAPDTT